MDEKRDLERRAFLKKAGATGLAAAWAAPVVQTVIASPAFASGRNGTGQPGTTSDTGGRWSGTNSNTTSHGD